MTVQVFKSNEEQGYSKKKGPRIKDAVKQHGKVS